MDIACDCKGPCDHYPDEPNTPMIPRSQRDSGATGGEDQGASADASAELHGLLTELTRRACMGGERRGEGTMVIVNDDERALLLRYFGGEG